MSNDRLKYLLQQFAADICTPAEVRELFHWIRRSNNDVLLKEKIRELWDNHGNQKELPGVDWDKIYIKIINAPQIGKRTIWWKYAAAAVVVLLLSTAGYLWFNQSSEQNLARKEEQPQKANEILPGGERAVLTLADGSQVILDSANTGTLSTQGSVKVVKLSNGQLSYQFTDTPADGSEVLFNTISTPRGGQYQIVLSDGTKVWLNASSSLHFPATFIGSERNVELKGEGYFEVARNEKKPFNVSVSGMKVRVLGTHFNVSAYDDDAHVETTLLEGSVEIEKGGVKKIIHPGEQARVENTSSDSKINIRNVNVDDVIAWKNGRFIFQGDNIQSIMRQLSRWYDVSVSYEEGVTREEFVGVINRSRYVNIAEILEMLERTRAVSFEIVGRHVTVMPYNNKR